MFADSFCDTNWDNQSHRGWTTLLSFGLQAIAVTGLLALPLLYTQGLPSLISPPRLLVPMTLPRAPRIETIGDTARFVTIVLGHPLFTPRHIPNVIPQSAAFDLQPPSLNTALSGQSGTGNPGEGIFGSTGDSLPVAILHPPISTHHLLISHMMEGNLIRRVEPAYPAHRKAGSHSRASFCCERRSARMALSKICSCSADIPCSPRRQSKPCVSGDTVPII